MKNKVFSIVMAFSMATHLIGQVNLIDFGTQWKYFDLGYEPSLQDQIKWYEIGYNDQDWASGEGQLGYGEEDETTVLNTDAQTLYFRYTFLIIDPAVLDSLFLQLIYNDGAIVYLNNEEIWRINMPPGELTYQSNSTGDSPSNVLVSKFENNVLQSGTNVISVAIHQHDSPGSNASFDLRLVGTMDGLINLERGPYLQKASPHSMTVKWRNAIATDAFLLYGTNQDSLTELAFDLEVKTDHEIVLEDLMAASRYYYAIADANGFILEPDPSIYFETSPESESDQPISAWILGDCGTGNDDQRSVRDAYYQYMEGKHTDMILFLGNNAYTDGTDAEYQTSLFENMYESILRNTVAWSCLGNHDGHSANSDLQTGPYYDIFSFPTNAESGGLASGTEAYYSFDYGNMHFISLDSYESNRSVGGSMYDWCLADIQNTTADWIIAFWHHPPYSKGSHDSDEETRLIEMRQNFLPMLEDNGVDLVLSGHSHSYERSYFLNGHYQSSESFDTASHIIGTSGYGNGQISGDGPYQKSDASFGPPHGTVYVTAGSSGKVSTGLLDHPAMYYSVAELGSCLLETEGNELTLKFIRENGEVDDYFTIRKGSNCEVNELCDDGDPCTIDDKINEDCQCEGTFIDGDQDGICDADDLCPDLHNELIGTECNDQDPCTVEDHYTENCECAGIYMDTDEDGVCDNFDVCPTLPDSLIGTPCDDFLSCTVDDLYTSNCNCVGTYIDSDSDGVCDEEDICPGLDDALIGTACDDFDPCTVEDHYTENCECAGIELDADDDGICDSQDPCPDLDNSLIGTPCDDGDSCTIDDLYTEDCMCRGLLQDTDQDGVCDEEDRCPGLNDDLVGAECDDQNDCTIEDRYDEDCICRGILSDRDEDGICDSDDDCPDLHQDLIGTPCDDGDPCTTDDFYRSNCGCIGAYRDTDNDGVCDEFDRCEGQDDQLIGKACDDQNECTLEDVFTEECQCVGIYKDEDEDGYCYAIDPDDTDPCIPDVTAGTCQPCGPLYFDSFENGMGNWIDGGRDCARITGNANSGLHSVRIRDNSGPSSSLYTKHLDLTNYKVVTIRFAYFPIGMDANEDFFLEISLDGGDHFEKVRTWVKGRDFENNQRYFETIEIDDFAFSRTTVIRIRCDASGNNDQVYIDDIEIASCRATCVPGALCDDNDDCTELDVYDDECECRGNVIDSDKDGICDLFDRCPDLDDTLIGSPCDDGNHCTIDDIYTEECQCIGRMADEDGDGICDAEDQCPQLNDELIGQPCDDGQECTTNDHYTVDCQCIGSYYDEDNDGICDEEDECPGQHDGLIGTSCDDGDPCTADDIYSDDCICIGRYVDFDGDGICVGEDPDDHDSCNPNEQAVTCGSCPEFDNQSFENDLGIWNDGGSDCARVRFNPHSGFYSMRLRDNSGSKSSMFTDPIDFSDYEEVHVSFSYYTVGMEIEEDFFLEVSTNGGSSFTTIAKWTLGANFINDTRYFENRTIDEDLLSEETVIRLRCDGSNNSDQVYIDDVKLSACIKSSEIQNPDNKEVTKSNQALTFESISVYPNPSSSQIYIATKLENILPGKVSIINLSGREMVHFVIPKGSNEILEVDISLWPEGIYFVIHSINNQPSSYQKLMIAR